MRPKKIIELVSEVSQKLNLPENLVKDFILYYYKTARNQLSGLQTESLLIDYLGTFQIREGRVNEEIKRYKAIIAKYQGTTYYHRVAVNKENEKRCAKLLLIKSKLEKTRQAKKDFQKIKDAYKSSKKTLEKPKKDPGRNLE